MLSHTTPPLQQLSLLPRRTDSLSSNHAKPKSTSPIVQSKEDAKFARVVLNITIPAEDTDGLQLSGDERARRHKDHERELTQMLERMTDWVEELATLLQQAYKSQTELETALTLARSNLQLALANNEMLEEALKRGTGGGKDVGWRRWSEREGVRRFGSASDYAPQERPNSMADVSAQPHVQQQQSVPSRFFNFKSTLQRISSSYEMPPTSPPYTHPASASTPSLLPSASIFSTHSPSPVLVHPTTSTPPSRPSSPSSAQTLQADTHLSNQSSHETTRTPTAREKELAALLEKERAALKVAATAKDQLEGELESLSQALFEEANKMVVQANRRLAETEEELRIATEQREALRSALRIVESENGALRGRGVGGGGRESYELEQKKAGNEHDDGFYGARGRGEAKPSDLETLGQIQAPSMNGGSTRDETLNDNELDPCSPYTHEVERETGPLQHTTPLEAHSATYSAFPSQGRWPSTRLNTTFDIPAVTVTLPTSLSGSFWSPETPNSGSSPDADTCTEENSNQSASGSQTKVLRQ